MNAPRRRWIAALIVLLAIAAGIPIAVIDDNDPSRPAAVASATPTTDPSLGPTGPTGPAGELDSTPAEIRELRDDTPEEIPDQVLERAEDREEEIAEDAELPPASRELPVAGAQGYSCRKDLTTSGTGSRGGQRVHSWKMHYAVARNIPGWADVDGVGDYLERVGLAAHFVIDFEGNCEQKVDTALAAYTQVGFNSTSKSIEIIAYGDETREQWLQSPLIKEGILAALARDELLKSGLPLKFVDPVGCVDQLGWTDHNALECGNDHHDVTPTFPYDVVARQIADGPKVKITPTDRRACEKVIRYRKRRHSDDKAARRATREARNQRRHQDRVRDLHARGLYCSGDSKVKRKT